MAVASDVMARKSRWRGYYLEPGDGCSYFISIMLETRDAEDVGADATR